MKRLDNNFPAFMIGFGIGVFTTAIMFVALTSDTVKLNQSVCVGPDMNDIIGQCSGLTQQLQDLNNSVSQNK